MKYCSLQHWTFLSSPVTSTTVCCFYFGSISSFFLGLFLHWSPVAYWAPTDMGTSSFSVFLFAFSYSSHVWMWELDYKESWVQKNGYFWTVVLEKTLESPLDCKEIQPFHPKGNQSWRNSNTLGHLMWRADSFEKTLILGKIEGRRRRGQQRMRWLDAITNLMDIVWICPPTPGVGDGQGGLAICSPWGCEESDMTQQLNWIYHVFDYRIHLMAYLFSTHWSLDWNSRRVNFVQFSIPNI